MRPKDLNELAAEVHVANAKWWPENKQDRNRFEALCLMQSEVCEAMEGERKGLMDDKLPHRKMAEVEMADCVIRALDYAAGFGIKLQDCSEELRGYRGFTGLTKESNRAEFLYRINRLIDEAGHCVDWPDHSPEGRAYDDTEAISYIIAACEFYCETFGYDLWGAYAEKMAYNAVRADHKLENRMKEGGKKW